MRSEGVSHRLLLGLLALALALTACKGDDGNKTPAPTAGEAKPAGHPTVDMDNPESCRPCHETVVEEWSTSMHARAHHSKDPIYAGVRAVRMRREGAEIADACANCHTPRAKSPDDPKAIHGVTCATCHNVASVAPEKLGAKALTWAEPTMIYGAGDLEPGAAGGSHGSGKAPPHMKDGESLCLACHDRLGNPHDIPICDTGNEHRMAGDTREKCTTCHMPKVDGPSGVVAANKASHSSHAFLGPHRAWYQKDASFFAKNLELKATLGGEGGNALTVTLDNKTGHSFPSGFPGRFAMVKATGLDASGKEVWTSPGPPPRTKSARHVMKKVYVTAEGKPTLAPYGVKMAVDSRLKPAEKRTLTWSVPAEVAEVNVALVFRLLPPPLAKKLGLQKALEAEPRVVLTASVKRGG